MRSGRRVRGACRADSDLLERPDELVELSPGSAVRERDDEDPNERQKDNETDQQRVVAFRDRGQAPEHVGNDRRDGRAQQKNDDRAAMEVAVAGADRDAPSLATE